MAVEAIPCALEAGINPVHTLNHNGIIIPDIRSTCQRQTVLSSSWASDCETGERLERVGLISALTKCEALPRRYGT